MLKEIITHRNLIKQLVIKDLKVRYARPALGFIWAFLSPLLTTAIYYLIFGVILKVKIDEAPFLLYLMSAVFPWSFFQGALSGATTSLMDNRNLIKESNFPQCLIPVSVVFSSAVNFLPGLLILIITAAFILKGVSVWLFILPVVFLLHLIIALGLSVVLSIVYLRHRDIKYLLEPLLSLLFYLTPAFYSIKLVQSAFSLRLLPLYFYNPFVTLLDLYRVALLRRFSLSASNTPAFLYSLVILCGFGLLILVFASGFYAKKRSAINDYLSY